MVPPPSRWHQEFVTRLEYVLLPVAERMGLKLTHETGLFRPGVDESDYRTPDLVVYKPENGSERGVEGQAELVVEVLSPKDESRAKLPFYESVGTCEVLLIEPNTREVELFVLRAGKLHVALPDERGEVRSAALGVGFRRVEGPRLRVEWSDGKAEL